MTRVDTSHPAFVRVQRIVSAKRAARRDMLARHAAELSALNEGHYGELLAGVRDMKDAGMSNYAVGKALGDTNWGRIIALVDAAEKKED